MKLEGSAPKRDPNLAPAEWCWPLATWEGPLDPQIWVIFLSCSYGRIHGGPLRLLTGYFGIGPFSSLWSNGASWYVIFYLYANFQLSAIIWKVQRTPCLQSYNWRILMNPHWILGGWSPFQHNGSQSFIILELCANLQLSSMNIRVSRTPYLEDMLWGKSCLLIECLGGGAIVDITDHINMWFLLWCQFPALQHK